MARYDDLTLSVTSLYNDGAVTQSKTVSPAGIKSVSVSGAVMPGEDVSITCAVKGDSGNIGWYSKCFTLYPDHTYTKEGFIYSVIKVKSVREEDYGLYTCVYLKHLEMYVRDVVLKPDNICKVPSLIGGRFGETEFIHDGGDVQAECDYPYTIANSTESGLVCRAGSWEGVVPRCVHQSMFGRTTMTITLICAGLLLACIVTLAYYFCYNKAARGARGARGVSPSAPDDVTLEKMRAVREFVEDVERFEEGKRGGYKHAQIDLPSVQQ